MKRREEKKTEKKEERKKERKACSAKIVGLWYPVNLAFLQIFSLPISKSCARKSFSALCKVGLYICLKILKVSLKKL